MKLTTVKEIYRERDKYLDQEITVGGWVRSVRESKTFGFIVVNDGTYFEPLQIVYRSSGEFCRDFKTECRCCNYCKGKAGSDTRGKQPFEIQAAEIWRGTSAPDYPLQKNATVLSI